MQGAAAVLHEQLELRAVLPVQIGADGKIGRERVGLALRERLGAVNPGVVGRSGARGEIEIQTTGSVAAVCAAFARSDQSEPPTPR